LKCQNWPRNGQLGSRSPAAVGALTRIGQGPLPDWADLAVDCGGGADRDGVDRDGVDRDNAGRGYQELPARRRQRRNSARAIMIAKSRCGRLSGIALGLGLPVPKATMTRRRGNLACIIVNGRRTFGQRI
jgi:hypothetical protein